MKTTRKMLLGRCGNLEAQLAAAGHESRTKRAARLKDLEAGNEKLINTIKSQAQTIEELEEKLDQSDEAIENLKSRLAKFKISTVGPQQTPIWRKERKWQASKL